MRAGELLWRYTLTTTHPLERVLVLGGGGLLGAALMPALREAGVTVAAPPRTALDLLDLDALRAHLRDLRPDVLVNTAAQSKVDQAELDPDGAFAVNAVGAHNAAIAASEVGVPLVHLSTDYVFEGARRTPHREYHPTGLPPNVYGQSKLEGEMLVRATWCRHFIVRVAALYGEGGRPDFVDWILEKADPSTPLRIVADRFVSPTWTAALARQLLVLMRTPFFGTYHATGHGAASWYELARSALLLSHRDPAGVVPISDHELKSVACRAPYTALENHLLRIRGLDTMVFWRDALQEYLHRGTAQ
jgi:dTDP-4-dehydrorhamnose reductase